MPPTPSIDIAIHNVKTDTTNVASKLETQGTHARAHYSASTRPACQSYVCISLLWTMRAIQGAFVRDTCAAKAKQVSMRMR